MYSRFHEHVTYACIYKIVFMQRHPYLLDRTGLDTPKPCLYSICIPIQHLSFLFRPRCVCLSCDLATCWIVWLSMDTPEICRLSKMRYSIYCDLTSLLMRVVGVIYLELDGYRVQAYEGSMRLVSNIQVEICCSLKGFEIKVLLVMQGANILEFC